MPSTLKFQHTQDIALVGPAMVPVSIGTGSTSGAIPFVTGAYTNYTREILVAGTSDGNIHCVFAGHASGSTGETIPVKAGQRYPWALVKVYSSGTTVTGIWGFY